MSWGTDNELPEGDILIMSCVAVPYTLQGLLLFHFRDILFALATNHYGYENDPILL